MFLKLVIPNSILHTLIFLSYRASTLLSLTIFKVQVRVQRANEEVCSVEWGICVYYVSAQGWVNVLWGILVRVRSIVCPVGEVADHLVSTCKETERREWPPVGYLGIMLLILYATMFNVSIKYYLLPHHLYLLDILVMGCGLRDSVLILRLSPGRQNFWPSSVHTPGVWKGHVRMAHTLRDSEGRKQTLQLGILCVMRKK